MCVAINSKNRPREATCLKAFLICRTSVSILESNVTGKLILKSSVPPEWVGNLSFKKLNPLATAQHVGAT